MASRCSRPARPRRERDRKVPICCRWRKSRRLITQKTKEALAKRKEIQPIKIEYPATIRWDYLPKGSLRTHNPAFKPFDNPRRVEKTGDSVEALLIDPKPEKDGKPK